MTSLCCDWAWGWKVTKERSLLSSINTRYPRQVETCCYTGEVRIVRRLIPVEERLHLFEQLQPVHRLIDFWCAHPKGESFVPITDWTLVDWQTAKVYLHPQLRTDRVQEDLINCINGYRPFEISSYVPLPSKVPILIESMKAACLLPLWEGACSVTDLAERWLKLRPIHPVTLVPVSRETAFEEVNELLKMLEAFIYVLLERSA